MNNLAADWFTECTSNAGQVCKLTCNQQLSGKTLYSMGRL